MNSKYCNNNSSVTRLVLLLDSSGSMSTQRRDVIGGINETIRQQRSSLPEDKTTMFTVITFSNEVSSPIDHKLATVPFFTEADYSPNGSTALYDAMGLSIERYKNESNVIFLIMTDGEENSSKHYTHPQVTQMIQKAKDTKNWNFIYLSEDITTFKQGDRMGLNSSSYNCNNVLVEKNKLGSMLSGASCQQAICDMRQGQSNVKIQTNVTYNPSSSSGVVKSVQSKVTVQPTTPSSSLNFLHPTSFFPR